MTPHTHAELIKAWAEGYQIEEQWENRGWVATDEPRWFPSVQYRIQPEAKASTSRWALIKQTSKG